MRPHNRFDILCENIGPKPTFIAITKLKSFRKSFIHFFPQKWLDTEIESNISLLKIRERDQNNGSHQIRETAKILDTIP